MSMSIYNGADHISSMDYWMVFIVQKYGVTQQIFGNVMCHNPKADQYQKRKITELQIFLSHRYYKA